MLAVLSIFLLLFGEGPRS